MGIVGPDPQQSYKFRSIPPPAGAKLMKSAFTYLCAAGTAAALVFAATMLSGQDTNQPLVPILPPAAPFADAPDNNVQIFALKHADAVAMADLLKPFVKGNVGADARSNQLIVSADKDAMAAVERLIQQLDVVGRDMPAAKDVADNALFGGLKSANNAAVPIKENALNAAQPQALNAQVDALDAQVSQSEARVAELTKAIEQFGALIGRGGETGREQLRRLEAELAQARATLEQAQAAKTIVARGQGVPVPLARGDVQVLVRNPDRNPFARAGVQDNRWVTAPIDPLTGVALTPNQRQVDQAVNALSNRLRQLKRLAQPTDEQKAEIDKFTRELRESLDRQFKETQKAQLDEVNKVSERLAKLQREIAERSKNREAILSQRLEDILSGKAGAGGAVRRGAVLIFNNAGNGVVEEAPIADPIVHDAAAPGAVPPIEPLAPPADAATGTPGRPY